MFPSTLGKRLRIATVYEPSDEEWEKDYKTRKKKSEKMGKRKEFCDFCGGELHRGKKVLEFKVSDEVVLCRDLPVSICGQCGEAYLDAGTSEKVEKFLKKVSRIAPEEDIPIPVFTPSVVLR